MKARGYGLIAGLVIGLSLALLPLVADEAAAQVDIAGEECGGIAILCQATDNESSGGNATGGDGGNGGRGGNGGFASVHDIANAHADASSSVIVGDITTGDAFGHNINVDARGGEDPSSIAGSFSDTGVDIFAPGGNAQSGTTGGNGLSADASGGDGGDGGDGGHATGGDGGDITSTQALAAAVDAIIIAITAVEGIA
jgi:hypothetical protein